MASSLTTAALAVHTHASILTLTGADSTPVCPHTLRATHRLATGLLIFPSRSHSHLRCGLLKWIPAGSGRWWWGVLWSKDIFLTGPFPTSSEHIHCSSAKSVNVFPSSCPCFEALHLPLPSIHLSAYPTGFTTQMLQQSDGWNICGAFLFRPRCPPLQRAAGVD